MIDIFYYRIMALYKASVGSYGLDTFKHRRQFLIISVLIFLPSMIHLFSVICHVRFIICYFEDI